MVGRFNINFRPQKKGFETIFGELEASVMEVVWMRGEASVRDVLEALNEQRTFAYTTILSTMRNLFRKGFLQRSDKNGTADIYHASYTKEELASLAVNEVVAGLMGSFSQPFIACLADLSQKKDLTETVAQLEKLVEWQNKEE